MDPFATLGIDARYDVDLKDAEKKHRELSRALHPDKYAASGASERREALSRAVEVNEAWRIVRDSVRRAEALFSRESILVGETHEPKPSAAFLMDILEQREALAEAKASRDIAAIESLKSGIEARLRATESALAAGFREAGFREAGFGEAQAQRAKLEPLVPRLGELRFYRRFLEEVSAIEDELESAHAAPRDL
jgi:molecular chaperone HscB